MALEIAPGTDALVMDDEVLVFDGSMIHLLSGSGALIWQAVDGRRDRDDVVLHLAARHHDASGLADDVRGYLDDLLARGLLVDGLHDRPAGWTVPGHVAWVHDGDQVVVLDLSSGERQTLSASAARIWTHLSDGLPTAEVVDRLGQEFPDAPASLADDTSALVDALVTRGLLTPNV